MVVPLSQLNAGEQARVVWIASEPDTARRLTDLGFAPQEPVTCVIKGPTAACPPTRFGTRLSPSGPPTRRKSW